MDEVAPSPGSFPGLLDAGERVIGREAELDRLQALLRASEVRLVTLTGPAGVGKTRLAVQAAADAGDAFDGGAVFVALAAVRDADLVVGEIARTLGVGEGMEPLIDRVARRLRGRRRLLVLDNVEHLLPAAPAIGGLLARCPEVAALITSRVTLRAPGEEVVPVAPLAVAAADREGADPWGLAAVRLFVVRAEAAGRTIERSGENGRLIAGICRRLDGLPLAIELAAAYATVLPLPALRTMLERRLPLLADPLRPGPARLQTMRDAIAWSYDLLPPERRALFRRLSVCEGGFSRGMAAALAKGWRPEDGYPYAGRQAFPHQHVAWLYGKEPPDHPGWLPEPLQALSLDIDDALAGLVRHHLVVRTGSGADGNARYEMLETIREYGVEQVAERDEEACVRHAHAASMLASIEAASSGVQTGQHLAGLARAEAELGNLRAALAWIAAAGEPANQLLLRMAEAMGAVWQTHGRRGEPRRWLDLALSRETGSPAARAWALIMAGTLAWHQGDTTRAADMLEESLSRCADLHSLWGMARSRFFLAMVAWRRNQPDQMADHLLRALPLYHASGDPPGVCLCQIGLGIVARGRRQLVEAAALLDEAYDRSREARFAYGAASARLYGGSVALDRGDTVRAVAYLTEGLDLFLAHGDPWGAGGCIAALATVAGHSGQPELAARLFGASAALIERGDATMPPTEQASYEAAATAVRAKLGERAFEAAFAAGTAWSVERAVAAARTVEPASAVPEPPAAMNHVIGAPRDATAPTHDGAHDGLTDLQVEIVRLLANEQSAKEIAQSMGKSKTWVYDQLSLIYATLAVRGVAGVVRYAMRHGLADPDPE